MKDMLRPTTGGSAPSKKPVPAPDASRIDGSLGFVPASEIRNVWTEAMTKLDVMLWPVKGPPPPRDVIIEFVADLQFRLLTRASTNLQKVLGKAAANVAPKVDEAAAASSEAARSARDARMAKYRG